MLNGKIGVLFSEMSEDPDALAAAVASAIADATGTFVSSKQPAGTHPCFEVSVSTIPEPVGSRCTTHQPRARERMTKVSPLDMGKKATQFWMRKTTYTTTSNSSPCSAMYGYIATAYETPIDGGISLFVLSVSIDPNEDTVADLKQSEELCPELTNVRELPLSSLDLFSTIGDMTSGQPACGVVPVRGGAGADRSLTSSLGGRATALPWPAATGLLECEGVTLGVLLLLFVCSDETEALRNACFCWATAIGERISLICLSMKTGFFFASFNF